MIQVQALIDADIQRVWDCWTQPKHIVNWNFATDEWQCPTATNDLHPGGKFSWRMEAKDGSMGFEYSGTYESITEWKRIEKHVEDGRKVVITFTEKEGKTEVIETFEPDENDPEMQRQGWQAILNNFQQYVESA